MTPVFDFESHGSNANRTAAITIDAVRVAAASPHSYASLLHPELGQIEIPLRSTSATPAKQTFTGGTFVRSPGGSKNLLDLAPAPANSQTTTAQGGLAKLLAGSNYSSCVASNAGDPALDRAVEPKPTPAKRKKNKKGKKLSRGVAVSTAGFEKPNFMLPPPPRFVGKPMGTVPDYGDPDWTFLKRPTPTASPSSSSRASTPPPRSGLSSLLSQVHPGDLVYVQGTDTSASSANGDTEPMVAYEVAIDEYYVDKDVDSRPATRTGSPVSEPRKKMTADDFEPLKCLGKGT